MITTPELRTLAADAMAKAGPGATLTVWAAGASPEHCRSIAEMGGRLIIAEATMRRRAADASSTPPRLIEEAMGGPEQVRVLRAHIKGVVAVGPAGAAGYLTSANLNRLTRAEFTEELSEDEARGLGAVADRIWAACPPGISPNPSAAYRALQGALREAMRAGFRVQPEGISRAAVRDGGVICVCRAGAFEAIQAVIAEAGPGATLDAVTWSMEADEVKGLASMLRSGRLARLRVAVPARWGRRSSSAETAADAVVRLGDALRWSPSHAKVAVVRAADGRVATITGTANFTGGGSLDTVRVRWTREAADEAQAFLDALPLEPAPEGVAQPGFFDLLMMPGLSPA